jgi:hypothetical protein
MDGFAVMVDTDGLYIPGKGCIRPGRGGNILDLKRGFLVELWRYQGCYIGLRVNV